MKAARHHRRNKVGGQSFHNFVASGEAREELLAGRTGGTEDPAVYFEVRSNGKPVNPRSWLGKP